MFVPHVEMNLQVQDGATPAQSAKSANRNLGNFYVPVNAPLNQKHSMSSQPIPNSPDFLVLSKDR